VILEGAYKYELGNLPGTVKFGGWQQFNAPRDIYTNFKTGNSVGEYNGIYGIVDQAIWKQGDDKNVTVFGRFSGSPSDRGPGGAMDFYFDTGILFTGFVPGRAKDTVGAAYGYGQISDAYLHSPDSELSRTFESVLELNYVAQIRNGVSLAPDFQYFWNPGSVADVSYAAVWGARLKVSY
jgi:porin